MNENLQKVLSLVDIIGGKQKFDTYQSIVKKTLPPGENQDRYWSMYMQAMNKFINDPKVTDKQSVFNCFYNAPKLGLNPDPIMGQIYFIPYKGVLTYQIGYKGMIALAGRTGIRVRSELVFEKDAWKYFEDESGQHFHWEPLLGVKNKNERGREIFAFSVFTDTKSGFAQIHVMESYHIDEIKKLVLARMKGASTPWLDPLFEPEMRKKTCVRRHSKTEPFSVEMARVIEHEEADERGDAKTDKHEELQGLEIPETLMPKPESIEDEKKLSAELDALAAKEAGQSELPFK